MIKQSVKIMPNARFIAKTFAYIKVNTNNESCIDKTLSCLLEGPDKTGRHLVYRTPFMQQCIIEYRDNAPELADIKITAANKASLRGEFVDRT